MKRKLRLLLLATDDSCRAENEKQMRRYLAEWEKTMAQEAPSE